MYHVISSQELDKHRDEWEPELLERVSTLLTNPLQQRRSWETDSLSSSQETANLSWNQYWLPYS
jgi:hypothetical protein